MKEISILVNNNKKRNNYFVNYINKCTPGDKILSIITSVSVFIKFTQYDPDYWLVMRMYEIHVFFVFFFTKSYIRSYAI